MDNKVAIVVTSINAPGPPLQLLAEGCRKLGHQLIIIGDEASPKTFQLESARFYSLAEQMELGFRVARICPTKHYARKNIGYLLAMRSGANIIVDLDDDCIPQTDFWRARHRNQAVRTDAGNGWVNVYRYFSDARIWPRGFPLDRINDRARDFEALPTGNVDCPIQQGLTDGDPDVDAIYRLTLPLPQTFRADRRVALKSGSWSPFNSQNTCWWSDSFPLLYLPASCRFRVTDIWRSFVAQRIAWTNDWGILFHEPTSTQERNPHDLIRDLEDEFPGYLHNGEICESLGKLELKPGVENLCDNLRRCYAELVGMGVLDEFELTLLEAWIEDGETIANAK